MIPTATRALRLAKIDRVSRSEAPVRAALEFSIVFSTRDTVTIGGEC
jgi:hypothetical protein